MDLETFTADTVIVHDVPRGNSGDEQLTITDGPIELDDQLRTYFRG